MILPGLFCYKCNQELSPKNIKRLNDVDGKKIGIYCLNCFKTEEEKIKKMRFVEEYKGSQIYLKDENYYPYWECAYYFFDIESCKRRIDDAQNGIAVMNLNAMEYMNCLLNG